VSLLLQEVLCLFLPLILKTTRVPTTVPQLPSAPGLVPHHATSYTIHSDTSLPLHTPRHLTYSMMRGPSLGMTPALAMSTLSGKGRGGPAISNDLGPPIFMPCEYAFYECTDCSWTFVPLPPSSISPGFSSQYFVNYRQQITNYW